MHVSRWLAPAEHRRTHTSLSTVIGKSIDLPLPDVRSPGHGKRCTLASTPPAVLTALLSASRFKVDRVSRSTRSLSVLPTGLSTEPASRRPFGDIAAVRAARPLRASRFRVAQTRRYGVDRTGGLHPGASVATQRARLSALRYGGRLAVVSRQDLHRRSIALLLRAVTPQQSGWRSPKPAGESVLVHQGTSTVSSLSG